MYVSELTGNILSLVTVSISLNTYLRTCDGDPELLGESAGKGDETGLFCLTAP